MTRVLAAIETYRDKACKTGQANALRLRTFVLVLRYTGMRLGDVATLSIDRLIGNKIQLYTQENRSARLLRATAIRRGPLGKPSKN
jgi:integrase